MPEIPELPETTILHVEVGSTAHGTGLLGNEDRDETAIFVEPLIDVVGLRKDHSDYSAHIKMHRTQEEGVRSGPGDIDLTVIPLRKFVRLAAAGNPSILMSLWAPVIWSDVHGESLRQLGGFFVGRHLIERYRRYMRSQTLRLLGVGGGKHGKRGGGQRPELIDEFGFDCKYAMHAARLGFQCRELLTTRKLQLPMKGEEGEWLRYVRAGKVSFEDWWDVVIELDNVLEVMERDEGIPGGCDTEAIEEWSMDVHSRFWSG